MYLSKKLQLESLTFMQNKPLKPVTISCLNFDLSNSCANKFGD
ncbi:hypothetical protein VCRA2119O381_800013 [Vibrio crassostreae]|nr:hypothetical protein VCRA2119O381_800013 [Vibrio crassostreae]